MSCDIHFKLEYKPYPNDGWLPAFGYSHDPETMMANYHMFAALADVRNNDGIEHIELKGFPDDAYLSTKLAYGYIVRNTEDEGIYYDSEEGDKCVTVVQAKKWIDNDLSEYMSGEIYDIVSDPDAHSPNWCSAAEYRHAIEIVKKAYPDEKLDTCYYALLNLMKTYEKENIPIRMVYWFDN